MSDFLNHYPYSDLHELNLDWIIKKVKELDYEMKDFEAVNKIEFKGIWNISDQYGIYSIVLYNDSVYISMKNVPSGIDIDNIEYWLLLGPLQTVMTDKTLNILSENPIANKTVTEKFNSVDDNIASLDHDIESLETSDENIINMINSATDAITEEENARQNADNLLNDRINEIIDGASVDPDAELLDIRVGANGTTYDSAGDAVRGQFDETNDKVDAIIDVMNEDADITLEMGNISATGEELSSVKNFRTADFIPIDINEVSCINTFRLAVAIYDLTGTFVSRTGFTLTSYNSFDHKNYRYRVVFKQAQDGDLNVTWPDRVYFRSFSRKTEALINTFDHTMSVAVEMEQGNISAANGTNTASNNNIRTPDYIPADIVSVSTSPDYLIAIAKYKRSDSSFVSRSAYTYTYYNELDQTNYKYKICLANKATTTPITPEYKKYLHFNTATLDAIVRNANDIKTTDIKARRADIPLLNDYLDKSSYNMIARTIRGNRSANEYYDNGFNYEHNTLKSHDASFCILNGTVYCVRAMYSTSDNAAADDCKIVLTKSGLDGSNQVDTDIAAYGDTLGGYTIEGGCGSPNLILVGTDIHILFTAHIDGTYTIFHVTYDTTDDSIGTYTPITVNGNTLTVTVCNGLLDQSYSASDFNGMQMNATIAVYANTYYAGICAGTDDATGRGAILYSSDLINWNTFVILDKNIITPVYEIACWAGTLGTNGLHIMTRSGYKDRKGYYARYRISDQVLRDECYILNGCTRPDFVYFQGVIFLLNTEDDERRVNDLIAIHPTNVLLSKMNFQSYRYDDTYQYLRGFVYNGELYGASTVLDSSDKYCIHIGKIEVINVPSDADIEAAIDGLVT